MKRRLLALCTTCLAAAPAYLPRAAWAKKAAATKTAAAPAAADDSDQGDADSADAPGDDSGETAGQPVQQP
jgi:hypothetical protein